MKNGDKTIVTYEVPTLKNQLTAAQKENKTWRTVAEDYSRVCRAYGPERVEVPAEAVWQKRGRINPGVCRCCLMGARQVGKTYTLRRFGSL